MAPIAVATSPAAAGGTGITATPAATVVFDGGNTQAQFVRAASGIINETNRVGLNGTTQNPWSSFDVWLQFRPVTGPLGTGSPTANPACGPDTVAFMPNWSNNGPNNLSGTPSSGYFIGSNQYNVCVYYTQSFDLTLLANASTSATLNVYDHVIYTGTFIYGSSPIAGVPIALTVWTGLGCSGSPLYTNISAGTTDATGSYSFDGGPSPFGLYSVMANATAPVGQSNCVNITVNNDFAMTLLANGSTSATVANGGAITYTGTLTNNGVGVSGQSISMSIYYGAGCTSPMYNTTIPDVAITDGSGNYTWGPNSSTQAGIPGTWYLQASWGSTQSNCITVTVS